MIFLRFTVFSVLLIFAYTAFTNVVPQVQSDPPAEEVIDTAGLDRAGQIAWGERLFTGKGTCTLCHNNLGRAPDLLAIDLGTVFPSHIADDRYQGAAKSGEGAAAIETYLRESMREPSAYVVAGFGKKGSNDSVSPMPNVGAAPIGLGDNEIDALIVFLQDRAGLAVTVPLPSDAPEPAPADEEADDAPAQDAEEVIALYGCSGCHNLSDSGANVGPPLAGVSARFDRERLRLAILYPNAEIAEGYEADTMPPDYADQLRAGELEILLDYLLDLPAGDASQ